MLTKDEGSSDLWGVDALIDRGRIVAVERCIEAADAEIIDGAGKVLMPEFSDGFRHNWQSVSTGRILKTGNSYPRYYDACTPQAPFVMTPDDFRFSELIGGLEAIGLQRKTFSEIHFLSAQSILYNRITGCSGGRGTSRNINISVERREAA